MVKTFVSPVRVYKYPFELIAIAYQTRFPYNEKVPMMVNSQMLEETYSDDRTKEKKVRRCTLKLDIPYLMRKISGIDGIVFMVTTELDWAARRFVVTSVNETLSSRGQVIEKCIFSVHPENSEWTCYEQDCSIEMISVWGFEQQAEKLAINGYIARLPKTKEVMEIFVQDVKDRGLHVPEPYQPPSRQSPLDDSSTSATLSCTVSTLETSHSSVRRSSSHGTSTVEVTMATATCVTIQAHATSGAPTAAVATSSSSSAASGEGRRFDRSLRRRRDSSGIDSDKLEAEYIQRFLGELTPLQESNLIQLRQKLSATLKDKMPNDAVLLRFLRARDFNIDKARDMVTRHVSWRKQYHVERLMDTYYPSDIVREYYAGGWHHFDKKGHPVYLIRLGQMDVKGLLKAVGEADLLMQVLAHEEEALRRCEQATRSSDKAISTVTLICDLEGLNLRHLWRPGIRASDRIIQILLNNYPETMGRLLFVRAPRIFPVLWAIVSQFLDETSREKFVFLAGNDYQNKHGGLTDYLDPENIPDFLGGPCKSTIPNGGLVPREMYTKGEEELNDPDASACALGTAYQTVSLVKERPCEVVLRVDCDSVLFWDFDVAKGKVMFTVLRLNAVGQDGVDKESAAPPAATTAAASMTTLSTTQTFSETGSYDSRLELSEAVPVVGPDLYQDTDSVQGTYTVNRSGIYLIRWEVCPPAGAVSIAAPVTTSPSPVSSPALPSIATTSGASSSSANAPLSSFSDRLWPKANIMYYIEVIEPERFEGSVSSLESWQSAVSTLSNELASPTGELSELGELHGRVSKSSKPVRQVRSSAAQTSRALATTGSRSAQTDGPVVSSDRRPSQQSASQAIPAPRKRQRQLFTDV